MSRAMRHALRGFVVIVTVLLASACVSLYPVPGPLPEPTALKPDPVVQLKLWDGNWVTMYSAQFKDDSIVGFSQPSMREEGLRIAIRRSDVITVWVAKSDFAKTIAYGVVGYFTGALTILLLWALADSP